MATQITQMCGIVYPVFAFTHCRDVVSIDFQKWGYLTGLTFTPDGKTMFVETAQPATGDPTGPPKKGAGKILGSVANFRLEFYQRCSRSGQRSEMVGGCLDQPLPPSL